MTQHSDPEPKTGASLEPPGGAPGRSRALLQRPRIRVGALLALAFAAGLIAWLVVRGGGSPAKPGQSAVARGGRGGGVGRSAAGAAEALGHPIFWLGPKSGYTYELTQTRSGKVYVRYLPAGVAVGVDKPYLTVATYPFAGAFAALRKGARSPGAVAVRLAQGGVAVLDRAYPKSVHAAYPGVDYQVEVFDPTPSAAMQMVAAGHLASLGPRGSTPATRGRGLGGGPQNPRPQARPPALLGRAEARLHVRADPEFER